jgi:hypothetical protein
MLTTAPTISLALKGAADLILMLVERTRRLVEGEFVDGVVRDRAGRDVVDDASHAPGEAAADAACHVPDVAGYASDIHVVRHLGTRDRVRVECGCRDGVRNNRDERGAVLREVRVVDSVVDVLDVDVKHSGCGRP